MNNSEIVELYYKKIDARDIDWVVNMFADQAVYERAEASYAGKKAIADFYTNGRKIQGKHTIEPVIAEGERVVAYGEFNGVGAQNQPLHIGFCDVWTFKDALVVKRQTYLAMGSQYVKE